MKYTKSFRLFVYQLSNLIELLTISKEPPCEEYFIYSLMTDLAHYVKDTKTKGKKLEK